MAAVPGVEVPQLNDTGGTAVGSGEEEPSAPVAGVVLCEGKFKLALGSVVSALSQESVGGDACQGHGQAEKSPARGVSGTDTSPEQSPSPGASLLQMEEKLASGQYHCMEDFVAEFKAVLEGYYQLHGADHWLSKQAQKLELMLEQKLSLLSREKTSIVPSKCYNGLDEAKGLESAPTRRRTSRGLNHVNTVAMESIMAQVLKQAEFLRAKEEKRIKEQERKEAEEANQKEMEAWDRNILALAEPMPMETMWEIPAIGHFLCLAQQILNLPEIVFYELERCLLMPQCNVFLSKIMSSLLSPPHRRPTLHRRPNLPYRAWEVALRQKVQQWYMVISQAENPDRCSEKLGLCSQFFKVLGEVNPLEQKQFHELTFHQKVWLLKGLCDFVYETQNDVQDAVLGQPIHECREVILGYDLQENAYIHFPQFCGADVRVYKQRPLKAPEFPIPPIKIKRAECVRLNRSKCKYKKNNGEGKYYRPLETTTKVKCLELYDECSTNCQIDNCNSKTEHDIKADFEHEDCHLCDYTKAAHCKENVDKPVSPGELVGYGEPLSPGEVRIVENVDKYSEGALLKTDTSPLKENALKTYQIHVNGNHSDSAEVICHRVAMDIILDHSLLNHKELKLCKMRTKKKKKKKKIKDENIQASAERLQIHTFKYFKPEIHNNLYLSKKRAKHKKHKSGKKYLSKKTDVKKKKIAKLPTVPEFQLVCTNLDELRELIKKIDGDLRSMENNRKKSGKWHIKRQGVKELHSTLTRLLNELLPWEPKLLKAFQRNRARLRKEYEDCRRLPDSEHFTKESCSYEECEANTSPSTVVNTHELCQQEMQKKACLDKLEVSAINVSEKAKMLRKDCISRDLKLSPAKSYKRQLRQYIDPGNEEKEISSQKLMKLSTEKTSSTCTGGRTHIQCGILSDGQLESDAPKMTTEATSLLSVLKGTRPIQSLIAKNLGNKVTLTSQTAQFVQKGLLSSEIKQSLPSEAIAVTSAVSSQCSLKSPLQVIYKLPDGQCVPVDLQKSPIRIQVQPITDGNAGDKVKPQFVFLPKNAFIPQKNEKTKIRSSTENQPTNVVGQHYESSVPLSSSTTGYSNTQTTAQLNSPIFTRNLVHTSKCSTFIFSQPPESTFAGNTSFSKSDTSQSKTTSALPSNLVTPMLSSTMSHPLQHGHSGVALETGNNVTTSQIVSPSSAQQRDVDEPKQELKTVCIRDSQSILVRTRGGNTGVVKVLTSQDQSNSTINPSSLFTLTPQLQSFMVSRSKSLTSSTFTSVTSPSLLPTICQSTCLFSQTSSSSNCLNPGTESNTTKVQPPTAQIVCQTPDKATQPPNIITGSTAGSWFPGNSHFNTDIVPVSGANLYSNNAGPCSSSSAITKVSTAVTESKISYVPAFQPDSNTTSKSDVVGGPLLHKVMLLPGPSALQPSSAPKISMFTTPTSSLVTSQKLVFINTQVPSSTSSTNVTLQASKQAIPTVIGKPYIKPTEQPQIILIPSTIGSQIKMSTAPVVSQVKDVRIGLTIGQTIVNTTGDMKSILPVNILQNTFGRRDDSTCKGFVQSTTSHLNSEMQNSAPVTCSNNASDYSVPATNVAFSDMKMTAPIRSQAKVTEGYGIDLSRVVPSLSSSFCSLNTGNTVALSTVKTGHLSSSLLLSNTQVTRQTKSSLSSLQMPVTSHAQSLTNSLSTNLCKSQSKLTPTLFTSTSPPVGQLTSKLNDSPTHQKLIINTSTPLAPGTQITVNGTRFTVPPQGMGVGSHVLLLSMNTKKEHLVNTNVQMCQKLPVENTIQKSTSKQNIALMQPHGKVKTMNSYGTLQAVPHGANAISKNFSPYPASSVNKSALQYCPLNNAPHPHLVPCLKTGSCPQFSNSVQFSKCNQGKEEVILNDVNSSGIPPVVSVISEDKIPSPTLSVYRSPTLDKPHTMAS